MDMTLRLVTEWGLGSDPGEDMDACKYVVPLQHGGTLNNCRAAAQSSRVVGGRGRGWEAPTHPGFFPLVWGWNRARSCCHL
ncbi:hypothetical protein TNCV_844241 [Trichonephila clavipes]|nr:hypothetical protein TNCV_844241 [Trichonephila clavipes]